jgi:2',3'-cyclic-nucleotide 2'-phosphodiesterase (5'-nucleotidase family)
MPQPVHLGHPLHLNGEISIFCIPQTVTVCANILFILASIHALSGWLLGHTKASLPEPNYSGDFGDFASFVTNMKQIADKKGVDLLLVDSGDLHDGTGLSDGFPPGQIDGQEVCSKRSVLFLKILLKSQSNKFFFDVPYDVLAIGK